MSEKYASLRDVLLRHTADIICKVLGRIFDRDVDPVEARELAREIFPDDPWKLEVALYDIGRGYCCPPSDPEWCYCEECPVGKEDECQDFRKYKAKGSAGKQDRTDNISVEVTVRLRDFIDTVEDYEKDCRRNAEDAFWKVRDELGGNFLARPLELSTLVEQVHRFLGLWRSYRHHINWIKLDKIWTSEVQRTASLLTDARLEDADDGVLAKADKLYLHLLSSNIEGMKHTNISKLLALSLTNLCVMWDDRVRKEFLRRFPRAPRQHRQAHGDYYRFLSHRRQVANELVNQVVQERGVNREKAVSWLRQLPLEFTSDSCEKPLAKLLDEYYY